MTVSGTPLETHHCNGSPVHCNPDNTLPELEENKLPVPPDVLEAVASPPATLYQKVQCVSLLTELSHFGVAGRLGGNFILLMLEFNSFSSSNFLSS